MVYSKDKDEKEHQKSICFVMEWHPDYRIGGSEIQAWLLAKALAQRGWRVHYVSEYDKLPKQEAMQHGVYIHGLKIRKTIKRARLDVLRYVTLSRLLSKIDADVYYQRYSHPYNAMVAHFAKTHNKRFIWACGSKLDCMKNTYTCQVNTRNKSGLKKGILRLVAKVNDELHAYALNNADRVLAQAEYQQNLLRTAFGIESVVIRNGHVIPVKLSQKDCPPIVLWVGTLKRLRRTEVFIELAERCKGLSCRFVLAGHPSDRAYAGELLKQMEGSPCIEYVGGVTFEESNDWIDRSSVFVNTSDYEGFPNTFIQAWLRGVPVVSLNVDPDDVLSRERIGFRSATLGNLCRDVTTLIEDRPLRETMGQRARSYAIRSHSIESITDRFLESIQSIL